MVIASASYSWGIGRVKQSVNWWNCTCAVFSNQCQNKLANVLFQENERFLYKKTVWIRLQGKIFFLILFTFLHNWKLWYFLWPIKKKNYAYSFMIYRRWYKVWELHKRSYFTMLEPSKLSINCGTHLELNDTFLWKTEVHSISVLHVEGALVQLRHRIVGVQDGHLLVNFANDESGQCHARDRTY